MTYISHKNGTLYWNLFSIVYTIIYPDIGSIENINIVQELYYFSICAHYGPMILKKVHFFHFSDDE